ncbi:MAG: carboxypeptidase regulatory-like domain-containing protein [Candidatus Eremiobacteraeota bacterium]|nr:carboxypeptidase regulatory-like domain-containing protein [Candidatus Eremiobacteraeota bacterium]
MGAKGCENPNAQGVTDTGRVVGTLVDAAHQTEPIRSATIQIGVRVARISPADKGQFTLDGVPTGTQTLQISSPGFSTYTTQVVVRKDQTSDLGVLGLTSQTGL